MTLILGLYPNHIVRSIKSFHSVVVTPFGFGVHRLKRVENLLPFMDMDIWKKSNILNRGCLLKYQITMRNFEVP